MKTCYYELLDVESTSTDLELKKAYRKKALQLHPDKNPDDVEAATARFALVRSAYEVLSDPQERSWYDSHKSQILRDEDTFDVDENELTVPSISTEEILRYFNPSFYTRMDDSLVGFYNVVGRLFERLAAEEVNHGKHRDLPDFKKYQDDAPNANVMDESLLLYPRFGNSKADYATDVRDFYTTWASFQSVKSFNWKDEYRYSSAPDRRTRRLMEKENKKARDAARKEYNETIRNLVIFIKRRDLRVKEGIHEFERQRKKKQQEELEDQINRNRQDELRKLAQQNNFEVQDWQKLSVDELNDLEAMLNEEYNSSADSEFDEFEQIEDENYFECFICNKFFKSEKQFQSHEQSNKHKKLVNRMKWEMQKEGIELGIDKDDVDLDEFETASSEFSSDDDSFDTKDVHNQPDIPDSPKDISKSDKESDKESEKESKTQYVNNENVEEIEFEIDDEIDSDVDFDEEVSVIPQFSKKKLKKNKSKNNNFVLAEEDVHGLENELTKLTTDLTLEDDDWSTNTKKIKKKKKKNTNGIESETTTPPPPSIPSIKKKNQNGDNLSNVPNGSEICVVCKDIFTSRNKLFQHVKKTGHAAPVPEVKKTKKKRS